MQPITRALLSVLLVGTCGSCMGQRMETNPELWYSFVVEIGQCVVSAKVPTGPGFISREPPKRFTPFEKALDSSKFESFAMFGYGKEGHGSLIAFEIARYRDADKPFANFADFVSHLANNYAWRSQNGQRSLFEANRYKWLNSYGPPSQRSRDFVIAAAERYYYPLTSEYALTVRGNYSGKFASNTTRHASIRAITQEVVSNVSITGCGYYESEAGIKGSE